MSWDLGDLGQVGLGMGLVGETRHATWQADLAHLPSRHPDGTSIWRHMAGHGHGRHGHIGTHGALDLRLD